MKKFLRNLLLFPTLFTSILSGYGKIILAVPIISIANAGTINVDNMSNGVWYEHVYISHILGATEGDDSEDARYLEFSPNPLHIYSHNDNDIDYMLDARPADSTTTYNLYLKNIGGFSGTADNFLRFKLLNNTNFESKNIFLGDANDSNDIVADIKYIIDNGDISPTGKPYGYFPLPDVEGSNVGVYDKRKVFFFNHADFNRDRWVNGLDFAIFARNWGGNEETDPNTFGANVGYDVNDLDAYSDIDRNGIVDYNDLSLFSGEWLWDANDPNTWSRVR
jgi:hypothetical protein